MPGSSPAPHERDERIVDDERASLESQPSQNRSHEPRIVRSIDAGNAETERARDDIAVTERLLDDLVQDLLDFELAVRLQVRAATAPFPHDAAVRIGEIGDRLGAAGIDSEDVHLGHLCYRYLLPMMSRISSGSRVAVLCLCAALVVLSTGSQAATEQTLTDGAAASPALPAASSPMVSSPDEIRALWVTRSTLTSPEAIDRMVAAARSGGFNALLVQVRGRGDAYYQSTLEPRASDLASRPGFDPLAETLARAHEAGIQVHAWIAVNLVSSAYELPASRQHIVYRQPDWLMVPREIAAEMMSVDPRSPEYVGRLARWTRAHSTEVEGLYASPIHPWAAAHLAAVVKELVSGYAVDGVHLDYVRYPGADFDFSRPALQQFKLAIRDELSDEERRVADARETLDPLAYANIYRDRYAAFRRSRLTALVMRLRTTIKETRPSVVVSAAVVPDAQEALTRRYQDWRTWLDQNLIDVLCPMAYASDLNVFERQIAMAKEFAGPHPVWVGVGAYRLSSARTVAHVESARRLGTEGIALFSYDALVTPPNSASTLTELGRAAFTSGSW